MSYWCDSTLLSSQPSDYLQNLQLASPPVPPGIFPTSYTSPIWRRMFSDVPELGSQTLFKKKKKEKTSSGEQQKVVLDNSPQSSLRIENIDLFPANITQVVYPQI